MTIIGITMGCPVGIGPEIILKYFAGLQRTTSWKPVVLGDAAVLEKTSSELELPGLIANWIPGTPLPTDSIPVVQLSTLNKDKLQWGNPNKTTGTAMARYIEAGVELSLKGLIDGVVTCPISKSSLNQAGYNFPGHTEMLASLTKTTDFAMMMAGNKLKVTLVTIHCPLADVSQALSETSVYNMICMTHNSLQTDFGIISPRLAVAGFNPHGGENNLFGDEEERVIGPAVEKAKGEKINVAGPFPPDTVFHKAANGHFEAVVCMYHDQGLIPFKLLHFEDGVNVTLGLPIVRTSVDHGTAYDIAGKGVANPLSLAEAVRIATVISDNRKARFS